MGFANRFITEKYLNILKENAELADWPKKLRNSAIFLGEVTPDGESGLYQSAFSRITFWVNKQGQLHRRDGPAYIIGGRNRQPLSEEDWYINGVRHRLDGPAIIRHRLGKIDGEFYYIDGKLLTKDQFDRKVKEIKGLQQAGEPYGVDLTDLEENRISDPNPPYDGKKWRDTMYGKFTGEISPDGESAKYVSKEKLRSGIKDVEWLNKKGEYHYNYGPAVETDFTTVWFVNGKKHRLDGPAVITATRGYPPYEPGTEAYYINDVEYSKEGFDKKIKEIKGLHQAGEPYGVDLGDLEESTKGWPERIGSLKFSGKTSPDGESGLYKGKDIFKWFNKQEQFHNNFGPAIEYPEGTKVWAVNDTYHRLDGPAIEYPSGTKKWYINGIQYTKEDYVKKVREMEALKKAGEPYGVDLGDLEEGRKAAMLNGWKLKRGPLTFTGNVSTDGESGEYMHPVEKFVKWYTKDGVQHRSDGPAYLSKTGNRRWFVNGLEHRIGGPSSIYPRDKMEFYFINGVHVGKEVHDKIAREQEALKKAGEPYGVDLNDLEESKKNRSGKATFSGRTMAGGWPEKASKGLNPNLKFTGEVSPDGESGKYKNKTDIVWLNKQGEFHNNYGPANVYQGELMYWYVNDKAHRLDGPAFVNVNYSDYNRYYINDIHYPDKEDYVKKVKEMEALKKAGEPYGVDLNDL